MVAIGGGEGEGTHTHTRARALDGGDRFFAIIAAAVFDGVTEESRDSVRRGKKKSFIPKLYETSGGKKKNNEISATGTLLNLVRSGRDGRYTPVPYSGVSITIDYENVVSSGRA